MATATLSTPGSAYGPCDDPPTCEHTDCFRSVGMAGSPCVHCGEPIGYDSPFFDVTKYDERRVGVEQLAHARCEYEAIEAGR